MVGADEAHRGVGADEARGGGLAQTGSALTRSHGGGGGGLALTRRTGGGGVSITRRTEGEAARAGRPRGPGTRLPPPPPALVGPQESRVISQDIARRGPIQRSFVARCFPAED